MRQLRRGKIDLDTTRTRSPEWAVLAALALSAVLALAACGGGAGPSATAVRIAPTLAPLTPIAALPTMALESVFADNSPFPGEYTCQGLNTSPPLHWSGAPAAAKSFAVFMDDPDAGGTFEHWVIYNIPPELTEIPAAVPTATSFADGTQQGVNSAGAIGYTGPCPSRGALHHYRFFLYALDANLPLGVGVTKQDVTNAMNGHIIALGKLTATYRGP